MPRPKTGTTILCKPTQSKRTWKCHKNHLSPNSVLLGVLSDFLRVSTLVLDGVTALPRSCLPLSLIVPLASCFPVSQLVSPLVSVSACPSCCHLLLDGLSAFPRPCLPCLFCLPVSQLLSPSLPPSLPPLVSPLVPPLFPSLSFFLFPFVRWCVRLPEALSPLSPKLVSKSCLPTCPPSCFPSLFHSVGWCARRPRPCPLVSQLVSQLVFRLVSLCWTARLPSEALSPLSSSVSPLVSQLVSSLSSFLLPFVLWCVHLPGLVALVSELAFLLVSLCWTVRLSARGLRPLSPSLTPRLSPRLSLSLSPSLSAFLLLDGVSPLSPSFSFFLFSFVGWCVSFAEALSPLSPSFCLPVPSLSLSLCPSLSPSWSSFLLPSLILEPGKALASLVTKVGLKFLQCYFSHAHRSKSRRQHSVQPGCAGAR